jgi:hypothetical protein
MTIVKIHGGLGNQMFQFAFGEALRNIHYQNVYYDISFFDNQDFYIKAGNAPRKFDLIEIFPVVKRFLTTGDFLIQLEPQDKIYNKILRRFSFQFIGSKLFKWIKDPQKHYRLIENNLLKSTNVYFEGYWQNLKYFEYIKDVVNNWFVFDKNFLNQYKNANLVNELRSGISVSIHIRRGDYVNSKYFKSCSISYFEEAIKRILNIHPSASFHVFTDDVRWVKDNLENLKKITPEINLVSEFEPNDLGLDMYLMSLCNHNIISNSTFSWWAAYLNKSDNKILIAPKYWTNDSKINQYIQESLLENFYLINE